MNRNPKRDPKLAPLRAAWARNAVRFRGGTVPTDAQLVAWAAECVNALITLDTLDGAPMDADEFHMWQQVTSGWPLGSVG